MAGVLQTTFSYVFVEWKSLYLDWNFIEALSWRYIIGLGMAKHQTSDTPFPEPMTT